MGQRVHDRDKLECVAPLDRPNMLVSRDFSEANNHQANWFCHFLFTNFDAGNVRLEKSALEYVIELLICCERAEGFRRPQVSPHATSAAR